MLTGGSIQELVDMLLQRQASLFHACQLRDFRNYLEIGGIPSHDCMSRHEINFTPLDSDANDMTNGVWDKVFVNLCDFGSWFAQGSNGVPNVYGPITLQLHPEALLEAEDVAVCLRSAGVFDFDRRKEALGSLAEINALFCYPVDVCFPRSTVIKNLPTLKQEFGAVSHPEVSLTIRAGFLPLKHAIVVWVDPYIIRGHPFLSIIEELTSALTG